MFPKPFTVPSSLVESETSKTPTSSYTKSQEVVISKWNHSSRR